MAVNFNQSQDFRMYLEDTMANDTTNGIEEISNDISVKKNDKEAVTALLQHFKHVKTDLEESFDKERVNMEDYFENEKTDIVKGFIIEKEILAKQHQKEKQGLINNFISEREQMLENFQDQVKEIEYKMKKKNYSSEISSEAKPNGRKLKMLTDKQDKRVEHQVNNSLENNKLLIKVDEKSLITPEDFIKHLEIEEKFESEKENLERSFKEEKIKLRNKIESECDRKLAKERRKYENKINELLGSNEKLKHVSKDTEGMWKVQATRLEQQFQKERLELDSRHKEEKSKLRRKLEEQHSMKLSSQRSDYDRNISDLKAELRKIKKDFEFLKDDNSSKENTILLKNEITNQLQENFDRETKVIRDQNVKLNSDVKYLTTEKYDLQRKIRELESRNDNDSALLKEYTEKVNKEYEYKMKRLISECEKFKMEVNSKNKEIKELEKRLSTFETCEKNMEGRLNITEQTVKQCEDTINTMRNENTNLSHEINLLRSEKDDLQKHLERQTNNERHVKVNSKKLDGEFQDLSNRYMILEREKLQNERLISNVRKELETTSKLSQERLLKFENLEKELQRQRQLLEGEKKENQRLHDRFNQDAALLRKKDDENGNMRNELENIKTEFASFKTKIQLDNEKILNIQSEKNALLNQIEKIKKTENLQKKHEIIAVQNSYVKEFAKRLEFVKANYEREIKSLKQNVEELKNSYSTYENKNIEDKNEDGTIKEFYGLYDRPPKSYEGNIHLNIVTSSLQDLPTRDLGPSDNIEPCKPITKLAEVSTSNNPYDLSRVLFSQPKSHNLKLPRTHAEEYIPNPNISPLKFSHSTQSSAFHPVHQSFEPNSIKTVDNLKSTKPVVFNPRTHYNLPNKQNNQINHNTDHYSKLDINQQPNDKPGNILQRIYTYMKQSPEPTEFHTDTTEKVSLTENDITDYSERFSTKSFISPNITNSRKNSESSNCTNTENKTNQESPRRQNKQNINSTYSQLNREKIPVYQPPINEEKESLYSAASYSNDSGFITTDRSSLKCPKLPNGNEKFNGRNENATNDVMDIFTRIHNAEKKSDNDELRKLLKDVRKEVLLLNKLMDERTPNSTPRQSVTPDSSYSSHSNKNRKKHQKRTSSASPTESTTEIKRLNEENVELQRRLEEQEKRIQYQETSCDDLFKRRVLLEKLVERLQTRLREETSKRRQIEQSNNVIPEDSKEGLDDSTV